MYSSALLSFFFGLRSYVKLELPTPAITCHEPQLQYAGFRNQAFQRHGHGLARVAGQDDLHGRGLLDALRDLVEKQSRGILLALGRLEEAELRAVSDAQRKLPV